MKEKPGNIKSQSGTFDPTSTEKAPFITGLESPFDVVLIKLSETIQKGNFWEGIRVPLEQSLPLIEIQAKYLKDLPDRSIISEEKALDRLLNHKPILEKDDLLHYQNDFARITRNIFESTLLNDKADAGGLNFEQNLMSQYLEIPESLINQLIQENNIPEDDVILALNASHQAIATHAAIQIRKLIEDKMWALGYCPICGTGPEMGRIASKDNHFYLVCSLCLTEWKFNRIGCPFCGNLDMKKLGHFTADEYPGYQVNYCKECNSYIKVSREKELNRNHLPIYDNLMTLELDSAAESEGYKMGQIEYKGSHDKSN